MKLLIALILLFSNISILIAGEQSERNIQTVTNNNQLFNHKKINDEFYIIDGDGTNIGVFIGLNSIFVVDTIYPASGKQWNEKLIKAIQQISDKPIKYLVNTHSHPDHSGGNVTFSNHGATIISNVNAQYSPFIDHDVAIPSQLHFSDRLFLNLGNEIVKIEHLSSHTFDDAYIYFEKSNVLFVGDNLITKFWHTLGVFGLESVDTWVNKALSIIDDETVIVPGHGDSFLNKSQLITFRQNIISWVDKLRKLHNKGLSVAQIAGDTDMLAAMQKLNIDGVADYTSDPAWAIGQIIRVELTSTDESSEQELRTYVGRYQTSDQQDIEIFLQSGNLVAKQHNKFINWLKPLANNDFVLSGLLGEAQIVFNRDSNENILGFTITVPEKTSVFKHLSKSYWAKI